MLRLVKIVIYGGVGIGCLRASSGKSLSKTTVSLVRAVKLLEGIIVEQGQLFQWVSLLELDKIVDRQSGEIRPEVRVPAYSVVVMEHYHLQIHKLLILLAPSFARENWMLKLAVKQVLMIGFKDTKMHVHLLQQLIRCPNFNSSKMQVA